jgi:phosphoglucosamine mutase
MTPLPKIEFGTDGIRGVAGEYPLDPSTVLRIGRAVGAWLRTKTDMPQVLVGRDTRISGNLLLHTLAAGLLSEGVDVVDRGVISTPGIAYLTHLHAFDMGIVISASHNPAEQNGIKLFGADGFKLDDAAEEAIEGLIETLDANAPARTSGEFISYHERPSQYEIDLQEALAFGDLEDLRLVLDCANGAAYEIAPDAFERAGCEKMITLNNEPDGFNINVEAGSEHVRRDRSALVSVVRAYKADIGIAFDGDADRVVLVTPEGMLVDGDHLLGILATEYKAAGKLNGDTVVATDMSNSGLEHYLAAQGISLSRTKVGDRYVMERLREKGFTLGGEQAGHIIVLENSLTAGDGIYAGLLVASLVARNKREGGPTLHELATAIPRYPQVIASAHLHARIDLKSVDGLDALTQATLAGFGGKGRVNLRFSGTEPNLLRAMVEGGPETTLQEVIDRALALCGMVAQATHTEHPKIDIVDCVTGEPIKVG